MRRAETLTEVEDSSHPYGIHGAHRFLAGKAIKYSGLAAILRTAAVGVGLDTTAEQPVLPHTPGFTCFGTASYSCLEGVDVGRGVFPLDSSQAANEKVDQLMCQGNSEEEEKPVEVLRVAIVGRVDCVVDDLGTGQGSVSTESVVRRRAGLRPLTLLLTNIMAAFLTSYLGFVFESYQSIRLVSASPPTLSLMIKLGVSARHCVKNSLIRFLIFAGSAPSSLAAIPLRDRRSHPS